eukprot:8530035-Pyramimonas_sp.AAC.1
MFLPTSSDRRVRPSGAWAGKGRAHHDGEAEHARAAGRHGVVSSRGCRVAGLRQRIPQTSGT